LQFEKAIQSSENHDLHLADFYYGIIAYLQGEKSPRQANEYRFIRTDRSSEWHMLCQLLTKNDLPDGFLEYEMHMEAFLEFAKPYLTGPQRALELDNPEVGRSLLNAIDILIKEAEGLGEVVDAKMRERLQATKTEISQS